MVNQVEVGVQLLRDGDLDGFGRLLHEAWMLKRSLASSICDTLIDTHYNRGRDAGALGGKVAGAGGGGFMFFYCPVPAQGRFPQAMNGLRRVPFKFALSGSRVIHITEE